MAVVAKANKSLEHMSDDRIEAALQGWVGMQAFEIDRLGRSELGVAITGVSYKEGNYFFELMVNRPAEYFPKTENERYTLGGPSRPTFRELKDRSLLVTFPGDVRLRLSRTVATTPKISKWFAAPRINFDSLIWRQQAARLLTESTKTPILIASLIGGLSLIAMITLSAAGCSLFLVESGNLTDVLNFVKLACRYVAISLAIPYVIFLALNLAIFERAKHIAPRLLITGHALVAAIGIELFRGRFDFSVFVCFAGVTAACCEIARRVSQTSFLRVL